MARRRFARRMMTLLFLLLTLSLILNSYLGLFPAYISANDPSTLSYYDYLLSVTGQETSDVYTEAAVVGAQEYVQAALLLIVLIWLILDSRRNRRRGPYVTSEPEFVRGSGTKRNPYILQSPNVIPAGGAALSQEVITLRKVGDNAIRTVTGPQFDISAVEQPHDVDYSKDDDTMVIRLKVDDRDPDDLDEGIYEFMLSFKILGKIHFLWLITVDYRKGNYKTPVSTSTRKKNEAVTKENVTQTKTVTTTSVSVDKHLAETEQKARIDALDAETKAKDAESKAAAAAAAAAAEAKRQEEAKAAAAAAAEAKRQEEAKAAAAAAAAEAKRQEEAKAAAAAAAAEAKRREDERKSAEIEAKKRMEAIDAEIEARRKALEEMDAKQRKKEEELIRVSERAKEIDFGTLGVAARSTASAPIEAGSDELSLGDTSAFEESGSAWVADDQGGLSISWTGKTASALIGVTGLKRAFAAAAVVTARDDLQTIKGVGPFIEEKLNALGITTFRQVANMTPELEDQVNTAIEFFPGRVRRDKWAKQAEDLDN